VRVTALALDVADVGCRKTDVDARPAGGAEGAPRCRGTLAALPTASSPMPTPPVPVDVLYAAAIVLLYMAALMALALARYRADYGPVARFLLAVSVADLARMGAQRWLIAPAWEAQRAAGLDPAAVPLSGLGRIGGHIEHAGFLVWSAGVASLALVVLARRKVWPALATYGAAVAVLVATYPLIRGDALRRYYLGAELFALATALASAVAWWRRREPPTLPVAAALLISALDIAVLFGPYRVGLWTSWAIAQAVYVVLYLVLVVIQGGALWDSLRTSKRR
jgi:hypothetical protein